MKIQEIYKLKNIVPALSPLERWYNRILTKEPEEMTAGDVLRSLRQGVFTEVAEEMLVRLLKGDVFAGDMVEGELLEALGNFSSKSTLKFGDVLKTIVKTAESAAEQHEWMGEEEKKEYLASVSRIKSNLANAGC